MPNASKKAKPKVKDTTMKSFKSKMQKVLLPVWCCVCWRLIKPNAMIITYCNDDQE